MARPSRSNSKEQPAVGPGANRTSWWIPVLVFAVGAALLATALARRTSSLNLEPVVAERDLQLDPELAVRVRVATDEVRKQPGSAEAHGQLGMLYDAHEIGDLALRCYQNAVMLAPDSPKWLHLFATRAMLEGRSAEAEPLFRRVVSMKSDFAPAWEHLGKIAMDKSDFDQAAEHFQRALDLSRQHPHAYLHLASARIEQKRFQVAVDLVQQALQRPPELTEAYQILGRAYRGLGKTAEADAAFFRAVGAEITAVPDLWRAEVAQTRASGGALLRQAEDLMEAGRPAEAVVILEKLHKQTPRNVDYINNLSAALMAVNRVADAKKVLDQAIQIRPDYFPTHLNLASALLATGQLDAALQHCETATKLAPNVGRAFYTRGVVLARMGRMSEAELSLREAIKTEARNPDVHGALGEVLGRTNQWVDAVTEFEKAVELKPKVAALRFNLAIAYAKVSRPPDAITQLEAAARLEPNNTRIREMLERLRAQTSGTP